MYTIVWYNCDNQTFHRFQTRKIRYCSRYAQTVTDFADASHAESAKSRSHYVILRNFQFRKFLPWTVTKNPSPVCVEIEAERTEGSCVMDESSSVSRLPFSAANVSNTLWSVFKTNKKPLKKSLQRLYSSATRIRTWKMLESESSALPFGDSASQQQW